MPQNITLAPYTTYKIGGKAKNLVTAYSVDSLLSAIELSGSKLILGRGSKVLIDDNGFDGTVILMRAQNTKICGSSIYAEAGLSLPALCKICLKHSLSGLEWACGIPGSVGGAVVLNAGAFGSDISKVVEYVDVIRNGSFLRISNQNCGFLYRKSGFSSNTNNASNPTNNNYEGNSILANNYKNNYEGNSVLANNYKNNYEGNLAAKKGDIICGASFKLSLKPREEIALLHKEYAQKRAAAQPNGFSCGSVFITKARPAWQYIDECNLKNMQVGGAVVSSKHANFIINNGLAKARDVRQLINTIKAEVFLKKGITLTEELIYVGGGFSLL